MEYSMLSLKAGVGLCIRPALCMCCLHQDDRDPSYGVTVTCFDWSAHSLLLPPTHYLSHLPWTDLREIDRICSTSTNIVRPLIKALRQADACDTAAPTQRNWRTGSYQSDGGGEQVERWYFYIKENTASLGWSLHPHIQVYGRKQRRPLLKTRALKSNSPVVRGTLDLPLLAWRAPCVTHNNGFLLLCFCARLFIKWLTTIFG